VIEDDTLWLEVCRLSIAEVADSIAHTENTADLMKVEALYRWWSRPDNKENNHMLRGNSLEIAHRRTVWRMDLPNGQARSHSTQM